MEMLALVLSIAISVRKCPGIAENLGVNLPGKKGDRPHVRA